MDQLTEALFIKNGSAITTLTLQTTVLMIATEALIATHPNPSEVRKIFDQIWGQFQATSVWADVASEDQGFARSVEVIS